MILHRLLALFRFASFQESYLTLLLLRLILVLLVWDTHCGWVEHVNDPARAFYSMIYKPWSFDIIYHSQPYPNGIAQFMSLTWIADNHIEFPLRALTLASLLLYLLRVPAFMSLALPTLFGIISGTLNNSQGSIGHLTQALHITLLCLWLGDLWRRRYRPDFTPLQAERLLAHIGRQAIAAGYVASALSKLLKTGIDWITHARYAPLQMVKNNDMKFYESLDPSFQKFNPLAQMMIEHPAFCQLLFGLGLPLELLAFMGCRNKTWGWIVGLSLFAFHWSVLQLMNLFFVFNMGLLLAFFIIPGLGKRMRVSH
jgi:hypothetical protein